MFHLVRVCVHLCARNTISHSFEMTHKCLRMNGKMFVRRNTHTHTRSYWEIPVSVHSMYSSCAYLRTAVKSKTLHADQLFFYKRTKMLSLLESVVSHMLTTERCWMTTLSFTVKRNVHIFFYYTSIHPIMPKIPLKKPPTAHCCSWATQGCCFFLNAMPSTCELKWWKPISLLKTNKFQSNKM